MATKMATLRAKAMAMAMAVAICRATWMEKTDGGKCNGNIGGKKHWQILGGGKSTGGKLNGKILAASKSPWQHTWQRKGKLALRAKAIATQVAKLWQKMWQGLKTRRVSGKSRWHIAWPKDIVCSRWLAQAASGIVSYAKQVNIFNQIVVVSNDQTECSEIVVFTAHLVSNCLSVVFWSNDFLCLSHAGTLRGTELKDQITPHGKVFQ